MKYKHRRSQKHPFRQIAITSFIAGGLSLILGIVLLLTTKADIIAHQQLKAITKIAEGLGFLAMALNILKRGYMDEHKFNLDDIYQPGENKDINNLMGQRRNDVQKLATEYSRMLQSR